MDETLIALRTAACRHNISVIEDPGTFGDETLTRLIDVWELTRRYNAGEPIKDLLP